MYFWSKLTLSPESEQVHPVEAKENLSEVISQKVTLGKMGKEKVENEVLLKLKGMICSGDETNIALAFQLMKGLNVSAYDLSRLVDDRDKRDYLCFKNGYMQPFADLNVLDFGRWKQKLKEIPGEIAEITQLKRIILPGHHLLTLPSEIGQLKELEWLNLYDNKINHLPLDIGELDGLRWLFLRDNFLETLPESIGGLKNLIRLNLSNNQLIDLPEEIGNLPLLDELNLNNNALTSLPESLQNLKKLNRLYVKDNPLLLQKKGELRFLLPNTKIFF